jgi:hypothetical protein
VFKGEALRGELELSTSLHLFLDRYERLSKYLGFFYIDE